MADSILFSLGANQSVDEAVLRTISYVGALVLECHEVEPAQKFIKGHCDLLDIHCDCTSISSLDKIISLLDSGCTNVIISETTLAALAEEGFTQEHLARLTLCLEYVSLGEDGGVDETIDRIIGKYGHRVHGGLNLLFHARSLSRVQERVKGLGVQNKCLFKLTGDPGDEVYHAVKRGFRVILPSTSVSAHKEALGIKPYISSFVTKVIRSDRPDGLFPTVVTDESGLSLGLVYSSIESIEKAMLLGRGVYFSRSRDGLWIKGEESGNVQELRKISIDCDADALQFTVRQIGDGNYYLRCCWLPLLMYT